MTNPYETQHGGGHYKTREIQPIEFILANNLDFCEGNVVKYVCRWREKNGVEDLKKAIHYLEFLIDQEERGNDDCRESCIPRRDYTPRYTRGIPTRRISDIITDDDDQPRSEYVVFDSQNPVKSGVSSIDTVRKF